MKFWINMFKHLLLCSNIYYCVKTLIVGKIYSNIYYCIQTFIIVFEHLFIEPMKFWINMFKHLLLCSNIYCCVQTLWEKYVQTFIIVFKHLFIEPMKF